MTAIVIDYITSTELNGARLCVSVVLFDSAVILSAENPICRTNNGRMGLKTDQSLYNCMILEKINSQITNKG